MTENGKREKLALVVDDDVGERRAIRAMLQSRGYDVVHASTGLAALELIQRLPASFHLVLAELDLGGLPAGALLGALRLFRPDLPVLCMSGKRSVSLAAGCLIKPLEPDELDLRLAALQEAEAGAWEGSTARIDSEAVSRARARYEAGGDLVGAALELARGLSQEN